MKKVLYIIPMALLMACGGGGNETSGEAEGTTSEIESTEAATPMNTTDLSEFGWAYTIGLPDKKDAQVSITENSWGGVDIQQGEGFWMSVNYGEGDLDLLKFDLEEHEFYNVEILEESPDHMVYKLEAKDGGLTPTFHFMYVYRSEGDIIEISNSKDADFSEEAVMKMLTSAKSLAPGSGV